MSKLVEVDQLTPREFQQFQDVIYQRSGIKIGDRKISLLSNRIRRRLRASGFDDFESYFRFLTSADSGEWEHFLDAITTHETSFFRTEVHYEWLSATFLPEALAAHRQGRRPSRLRIWSAACASGAEPYSVAICLAENKYRMLDWSTSIL
ncbi:MAG: CheR family methyltransferase, partial [Planctomycetota bacterium]